MVYIRLKYIMNENFQDYKKPSMYIAMPKCSFKCCTEAGISSEICHNNKISNQEDIDVSISKIIETYLSNPITKAIVIAGLEPFDTSTDVCLFVANFRYLCQDDIVIYTGYYENEISKEVKNFLKGYPNIIIKFGRYIPDRPTKYDEILGVILSSNNQYAKLISEVL